MSVCVVHTAPSNYPVMTPMKQPYIVQTSSVICLHVLAPVLVLLLWKWWRVLINFHTNRVADPLMLLYWIEQAESQMWYFLTRTELFFSVFTPCHSRDSSDGSDFSRPCPNSCASQIPFLRGGEHFSVVYPSCAYCWKICMTINCSAGCSLCEVSSK